jgi:hypothetical protein
MAIGVLGVLSLAGAAAIQYSTANARSAEYSQDNGDAYHVAEAGVNEMVAILHNASNPTDPTLLPETTRPYGSGTLTYSGTFEVSTWKWSLTSVGSIRNPTGATSDVTRTLTAKVPVYPVNTQPRTEPWNYVYSWGTGDRSCCDMTVNAGVDAKTRIMAAGNLCWSNGAKMSAGELLVGGTNTVNGSAVIGSPQAPVTRVDVRNGCRVGTGALHNPCQGPPANADKVWATTVTSDPGIFAPPALDLDGWYANASPGPMHPCETQSGTTPLFENEVSPKLRNRSVTGTFNLTPASSYTCRTNAGEQLLGELSWDNATKVLTVRGTIFIDGNAYVSQSGSYTGQATLYLSGSFLVNQARFCAVPTASGTCDYATGAWDPNARLLIVVANGAGGQAGVTADRSIVLAGQTGMWQGALYGGPYRAVQAAGFQSSGPIIADEVITSSSTVQQGFSTIGDVPTGMPGNATVFAQPDSPELYSG